ncbi:tRNA (guanosine(37)-N1)-methyltransferase TrmD [Candidatus Macondimonas diazotrophica]|jgi:tRNA (guanine37-N1)-methyltransferase|uniref:tRNA (guanine-N(1)-)-methyltransferase n=1 Tax=Candidatus Macondimonas diazotrophica TaxID=2305248 RepID=A0A4Z0F8V8_9GAMM|nr:tRNA (guanosine(37)-N1)-methyltransferase TrmD [Candidatus Macondimonas diazotrophica]NCU01140.1 tRNA (guanosine(37)-N1)-methyltransferase TrmD [Candidatus Macondimonas diazotrophica]TFZ82227.1 tRNA (guanosine(37)-N1)-methyltransferase TrmD [Candidatus Macondimonas diazotrophica]HBG31199.1 tRNA (guanosine(37)-N1)-methyltransferase TrmD [Gammaproteobacteria bacterium]HBG52317.1 tRNA (guanosine(37)-N1)-methyltransferase TrmD [Gammaproteobacteria bacterium]
MRLTVVSLFPELIDALFHGGIVGRARARELIRVACINPRDFVCDVHRTVDDRPYGGGPGMVMKVEPLLAAIARGQRESPPGTPVILMSPQGRRFDQDLAHRFADLPGIILVAGRYEGIDERVLSVIDQELSIGDYVLSGGELAAMVVMDAVIRLLPGAVGDAQSCSQDSFSDGLLDCPHYTRPELHGVGDVPAVLRSGNHAAIRRWRLKQSLGRTWLRRPSLLAGRKLTPEQEDLLQEFIDNIDLDDPACG